MRSLAVSVVAVAFLSLWGCGSNSTPDNNLTGGAPDPAKSTLTADRTSGIAADGTDHTTLTVTLKDASGKPVADQLVQLAVSGSSNTVSAPAKTNASGQTTATLASTVAEAKTVTATIAQGSLAPLTITFVAGAADPANSTVAVSPSTLTADGTAAATVTVTLKDAHGNPLSGQAVTLSASGSQNTLGQPAATGANGVTTGTLTSTHAEVKTLTATVGAVTLSQRPSVTFTAGAATQLAYVVPPSNAAAGTPINPAVQVEIVDAHGNRVDSSATVQLALGSNTAGGTLAGTVSQAAVAGLATFSDLSLDKAATGYTLVASASGLTSVTSGAFDITVGPGKQLVFVTQPPTSAKSQVVLTPAIQIAVEDAAGNVVTTSSAPVTVALQGGAGNATLSGTVTVNAVNGVASFADLSVDKAATGYQLAATSSGFQGATSTAFAITPGTIAQIAFAQQPSKVVAGANISPAVTVAVEDAAGNVVTSSTRTITVRLSPNPASGSLSGGTSVAVKAVNGIATFSTLTVDKAATGYGLKATDSSSNVALSSLFDVTPAAASQVVFTTQPASSQNGVTLAPVAVSVEDAFGNVVTGDIRSISLGIANNPGGATLSGTTTVAASAGVASFSNLSLDKTGTGYTLRASAPGVTAGVSAAFDITPAPITGSMVAHYLTTTGALNKDVPDDLSATAISAYVPLADGGFTTYPGTGATDGTFSIPNVPTVAYVLQLGSRYYPSTTRTWDFSYYNGGRSNLTYPDAGTSDAGTTLVLDVSGMSGWTDTDDLQLYSENANAYADGLPWNAAEGAPDAGATTWHGTLDYASLQTPLVDSTQGDTVRITQLQTHSTPGGWTYVGAANTVTSDALTVVNGQSSSLAVALSPLTQTTSTLTLDFPSFENQVGAVSDGGLFQGDTLYVSQLPVTDHGTYVASPDLTIANLYDAGTPAQTVSFGYGVVEPSWGQYVSEWTMVMGPRYTLSLPDGGTASGTHGWGYLTYTDTLTNAKTGGVRLAVSPVQQLKVNGADATTQALSAVGTAPVVSWTAPAVGTPGFYRVGVRELVLNGTLTQRGDAKYVYTTGTSVRLPPGVLQSGHSYYLTVSAMVDPAEDISARPYSIGFPVHTADALSQMITP